MDKQTKRKFTIAIVLTTIITAIVTIIFVFVYNKLFKKEENVSIEDNNPSITYIDTNDNNQKEIFDKEESSKDTIDTNDKDLNIKYIYRYIESDSKEVIKEQVSEKSTDAIIKYNDIFGNTKTIKIPSGVTISFSSGEHGQYNSIPSSITLADNQTVDITSNTYFPSSIEVNYVFKGFSYSGGVFSAEYGTAPITINVDVKKYNNIFIEDNVKYVKLDYLESTGVQYINIGSVANNNTFLEMKCSWNKIEDVSSVMWNCTSSGNNNYIRLRTDSGNYINCEFRRMMFGIKSGSEYPAIINKDYVIEKDISNLSNITVNGNVFNTSTSTGTAVNFPSQYVTLFADPASNRYGNGKIYYYKQWSDNTKSNITMDLIPALRTTDNTKGFFDKESKNFYENSGTGEFYSNNDYIQSFDNAGYITASGSYEIGSQLFLTAKANDGYTFVCWSDGDTNPNDKTIDIEDDTSIAAIYVAE